MDSGQEALVRLIRDALNHLHDPALLRRSPLAAACGVAGRFDTPNEVRRILTQAVEALEPGPDEPPQSRAWEIYQSVFYRYVEQFSQEQVANQMGISLRQLRRLQKAAFDALALHLREAYPDLEQKAATKEQTDPSQLPADEGLTEDLEWLKNSLPEEPTDIGACLWESVTLARAMAQQRGIAVSVGSSKTAARVAAHPMVVRQALLNVLTVMLLTAIPGSQASIEVLENAKSEVGVRVRWISAGSDPTSPDLYSKLAFARKLAELAGGRLALAGTAQHMTTELFFPGVAQRPVLVIDDNAETLRLMQRYAEGTCYQVIGIRDPAEALRMLESTTYAAIVTDVMMPEMDGWTILANLRQHPALAETPIIVCTVLPQRELALSLGANDFVQKPVSRMAFLAALGGQIRQNLS
ncbi:MAG: response regulator [Anaerolineae bacterium]